MKNLKHTLRTIAGVGLILFGIIGGFIPVLQGWVFVAAGIAMLGTDHALVRWAGSKLVAIFGEDHKFIVWGKKNLIRFGILKEEASQQPQE